MHSAKFKQKWLKEHSEGRILTKVPERKGWSEDYSKVHAKENRKVCSGGCACVWKSEWNANKAETKIGKSAWWGITACVESVTEGRQGLEGNGRRAVGRLKGVRRKAGEGFEQIPCSFLHFLNFFFWRARRSHPVQRWIWIVQICNKKMHFPAFVENLYIFPHFKDGVTQHRRVASAQRHYAQFFRYGNTWNVPTAEKWQSNELRPNHYDFYELELLCVSVHVFISLNVFLSRNKYTKKITQIW